MSSNIPREVDPYLLKLDLTACTWGRRDQNTTRPDRVKLFQHVLASWTQAQSSCTWSLRRRPKSRFTHRFCWPHTTSSVFPGLPRPSMNINEHHMYQKSGHPKWFNAASLILRQNDDHRFPLSIDSMSSRSLLLDEPSAPSSELYPAAPEQAAVQISSPTEFPKCELHPFRRFGPYDVHRCFPTVFQRHVSFAPSPEGLLFEFFFVLQASGVCHEAWAAPSNQVEYPQQKFLHRFQWWVSTMSQILLLCKIQSIEIGETSMTNMVSPQRSMNVLDSSRVRSWRAALSNTDNYHTKRYKKYD